jgi:hypothetical protein
MGQDQRGGLPGAGVRHGGNNATDGPSDGRDGGGANERPLKRKIIAVAALFSAWLVLAGVPITPTPVSLIWGYPTDSVSTDMVFVFYSTNTLSAPVTTWPFFTNVWATNYMNGLNPTNLDNTGTNMVCRLPFMTLPGQGFYVGVATNFWGSSDFSTVASTPPVPRSDVNVRLVKP